MPTAYTLGRRKQFEYEGSVKAGLTLIVGVKRTRHRIDAETLSRLLAHFRHRKASAPVGSSHDKPPPGSLGEWLIANHSKRQISRYVAPILVSEGYAAISGEGLAFP
ncbi:hypothetical protein LMG28140_02312 [Paraburkholderia metrosideri]|jgi:hypothetical protein|uniref:Uncharacterized protein n=1 Tax=Paraburkholderia metrosideri TaxID=580937 RepID=A0ABM8NKH6_9BURK|nr:hypothetical protein LMG28140_02312 [Paraburkholderia metrosideri]